MIIFVALYIFYILDLIAIWRFMFKGFGGNQLNQLNQTSFEVFCYYSSAIIWMSCLLLDGNYNYRPFFLIAPMVILLTSTSRGVGRDELLF
jgi:hypothetical protein